MAGAGAEANELRKVGGMSRRPRAVVVGRRKIGRMQFSGGAPLIFGARRS